MGSGGRRHCRSHRFLHLLRPPDTPHRPAQAHAKCARDRKSTRLNSSHVKISYAVFCLKKKKSIKFAQYSLRQMSQNTDEDSVAALISIVVVAVVILLGVNPGSRLFNFLFFFFNDTATTEIYTLSLHDALPI